MDARRQDKDDSRFDALVRSLATSSRRTVVAAATTALVAGTLGVRADDAAAKRKKGKRKKKHSSARTTAPTPGTTVVLPPPDPCAGVTCGPVPHGMSVCANGACVVSSCAGDFYDVDGDVANGCEAADDGWNNHSFDRAGGALVFCSGSRTLSGKIVSDDRPHDPQPDEFDPTTGAAPDFWTFRVDGCLRGEVDVQLTTTGGSPDAECYQYKLYDFQYPREPYPEPMTGSDVSSRSSFLVQGSRDFGFSLTKTCPSTVRETVTYRMNIRAHETFRG